MRDGVGEGVVVVVVGNSISLKNDCVRGEVVR